jgi:hypothetical protein
VRSELDSSRCYQGTQGFSSLTSGGIPLRMGTATDSEDSQRKLRELGRRFERALSAVDCDSRPLSRRESFHFRSFLEFLEKGLWEEADAALSRAEQVAPVPARFADLPSEVVGTADLRAKLARIIDGV